MGGCLILVLCSLVILPLGHQGKLMGGSYITMLRMKMGMSMIPLKNFPLFSRGMRWRSWLRSWKKRQGLRISWCVLGIPWTKSFIPLSCSSLPITWLCMLSWCLLIQKVSFFFLVFSCLCLMGTLYMDCYRIAWWIGETSHCFLDASDWELLNDAGHSPDFSPSFAHLFQQANTHDKRWMHQYSPHKTVNVIQSAFSNIH